MNKKTLTININNIDLKQLEEQKQFAITQIKIEKDKELKRKQQEDKKRKSIELKIKFGKEKKQMKEKGYYQSKRIDPYLISSFLFYKNKRIFNFLEKFLKQNKIHYIKSKIKKGKIFYNQKEYYELKKNNTDFINELINYFEDKKLIECVLKKYNEKLENIDSKYKLNKFVNFKFNLGAIWKN